MNIQGFGSITNEEITEFENATGFILPKDYREFLAINNGGTFQGENYSCIYVNSAKVKVSLNVLFGIGENIKKDLNIMTWLKEFDGEIPKTILIIGAPEGGGLILLSNSRWRKGVYLWDNTFELKKSNRWRCIYKLANTFTEFMERIKLYNEV